MRKNFIKRTLILLISFIGAVIVLYFLFLNIPANFTDTLGLDRKMTAEKMVKLNKYYHFDVSKTMQFLFWLKGALRGNLGIMYTNVIQNNPTPVAPIVKATAIHTIGLMLLSMLTSILISIPLGIISAAKHNSKTQKVISVLTLIGISFPSWMLAVLIIYTLRYNPIILSYMAKHGVMTVVPYENKMKAFLIPYVVIVLHYVPLLVKHIYTSELSVLHEDYVRTARSEGCKESRVLFKYAFKNALIPVISFIGTSFPALFSEIIIIEAALRGGGLGALFYSSISGRQYNLMMAISLVLIVITLLGNYIADLCYILIDPRLRAAK